MQVDSAHILSIEAEMLLKLLLLLPLPLPKLLLLPELLALLFLPETWATVSTELQTLSDGKDAPPGLEAAAITG